MKTRLRQLAAALWAPLLMIALITVSGAFSTINSQHKGSFILSAAAAVQQGDFYALLCVFWTLALLLYVLASIMRWKL